MHQPVGKNPDIDPYNVIRAYVQREREVMYLQCHLTGYALVADNISEISADSWLLATVGLDRKVRRH